MTGSCWPLLVFLLPLFFSPIVFSPIVFSPIIGGGTLVAQEIERSSSRALIVVPSFAEEPLAAGDRARSESSASAPLKTPPPVLRRRYPVAPANPGLPLDVFQQLVRSAGIIFSGRVTAVGNATSSQGTDHAATSVTFQVEHAMRGILPNQSVTIHEWAGLWSRGERYRVGERVLLFLYGPSKLGLTSTVAGPMGRFALDSQDRVVLSGEHIAGFAGNPILRGRRVISYVDFELAVRNAQPDERIQP